MRRPASPHGSQSRSWSSPNPREFGATRAGRGLVGLGRARGPGPNPGLRAKSPYSRSTDVRDLTSAGGVCGAGKAEVHGVASNQPATRADHRLRVSASRAPVLGGAFNRRTHVEFGTRQPPTRARASAGAASESRSRRLHLLPFADPLEDLRVRSVHVDIDGFELLLRRRRRALADLLEHLLELDVDGEPVQCARR